MTKVTVRPSRKRKAKATATYRRGGDPTDLECRWGETVQTLIRRWRQFQVELSELAKGGDGQ